MKLKESYLADFVSLLFPQLCAACGESLVGSEELICTECRFSLPYTDFEVRPDNIVAQQFWGRVKLEAAYALFYFMKGGKVQNLVHGLKYKGMKEIGTLLGQMAGSRLAKNEVFKSVDLLIAVPLHKKRLKQRGYNQAECFAQGIARQLGVEVETDNLLRPTATETQTHKGRFERFNNMQEVFTLKHPERLANKHILLVDDVITTGSTLEACGAQLLKIEGVRLSIATIAYAE
jgi:ComF family protein